MRLLAHQNFWLTHFPKQRHILTNIGALTAIRLYYLAKLTENQYRLTFCAEMAVENIVNQKEFRNRLKIDFHILDALLIRLS